MKQIIYIIMGLLCLHFVSAFLTDTFSTNEEIVNVSFNNQENNTIYVILPIDSYLFNGSFDILSIPYNCTQETANETATNCRNSSSTGYYNLSGNWNVPNNLYDEDYDSSAASSAGTATANITYMKPPGSDNTSIWVIKDSCGTHNLTIEQCWDSYDDRIILSYYSDAGGADTGIRCTNTSGLILK